MKKTYISPEALTVALGTCSMMAESLTINSTYTPSDTNTYVDNENQILTKGISSKSLWDEEW